MTIDKILNTKYSSSSLEKNIYNNKLYYKTKSYKIKTRTYKIKKRRIIYVKRLKRRRAKRILTKQGYYRKARKKLFEKPKKRINPLIVKKQKSLDYKIIKDFYLNKIYDSSFINNLTKNYKILKRKTYLLLTPKYNNKKLKTGIIKPSKSLKKGLALLVSV